MAIPAVDADVLEMRVRGFFNDAVEVNNVFHYRVVAAEDATLEQFGAGLAQQLSEQIWLNLSALVVWDEIIVNKLDADGLPTTGESYIIPPSLGTCLIAGQSLPPYATFTMKYIRQTTASRHGYKRFPGVAESAQADGVADPSYVAVLNAAGLVLNAGFEAFTIDVDNLPDTAVPDSLAVPIILQKIINGDPISPINITSPQSIVFNSIGTQNSRKFGRGS